MTKKWVLLLFACAFLCAASFAAGAEEGERVQSKKGEVANDGVMTDKEENQQAMSPDSAVKKQGGLIISKTLLPPAEKWSFKPFPAAKNEKPTHIDLWENPDAPALQKPVDTKTEIQIEGVFKTPKNAGSFPIRAEGNLTPPAGGGNGGVGGGNSPAQGWHWSVKISSVIVDITAYRPQHGDKKNIYAPFAKTAVPEKDEEMPGAGIRINGDDDDNDKIIDMLDDDVKDENDMIEVDLHAEQLTSLPLPCVLVRSNPNIEVWTMRTKGKSAKIQFDSKNEAVIPIVNARRTVWVEWSSPIHGTADLTLEARSGGNVVASDKLHFYTFRSIVVALGGENQVPSDPPNANHGTFQVAVNLYRDGYDVHMYDEDNVDANGAGSVYNEIVEAIAKRGVSHVAVFGYSHGGGSTHDLCARLNTRRREIGNFAITFTSYVDAVENNSDFDIDAETRIPPGSLCHINHYQHGSLTDQWLEGAPTAPPGANFELDVETTAWGANATHYIVDDYLQVRNRIETTLKKTTPVR